MVRNLSLSIDFRCRISEVCSSICIGISNTKGSRWWRMLWKRLQGWSLVSTESSKHHWHLVNRIRLSQNWYCCQGIHKHYIGLFTSTVMLFKISKFVRRYNLPKQRFSFQDKILSQSISPTKSKPGSLCDLCMSLCHLSITWHLFWWREAVCCNPRTYSMIMVWWLVGPNAWGPMNLVDPKEGAGLEGLIDGA